MARPGPGPRWPAQRLDPGDGKAPNVGPTVRFAPSYTLYRTGTKYRSASVEEFSYKEASEILQVPIGRFNVRLNRARTLADSVDGRCAILRPVSCPSVGTTTYPLS